MSLKSNVPSSERALSIYLITRKIFGFLNYCDLLTCAQVNKSWNEVATLVRKIRQNVSHSLLYHPYPPHRTNDLIQFLNSLELSSEQKNWISSESHLPLIINLSTKVSVIDNKTLLTDIEKSIKVQLRSQFSEPPLFVIYFMSPGILSRETDLRRNGCCYSTRMDDERGELLKRLSRLIPSIFLSSRGLILSDPLSNNCFENEFRVKNPLYMPIIVGLTIPKLPGLTVEALSIDMDELQYGYCGYRNLLDAKIKSSCKRKNIKGFILLSSDLDENYDDFIEKFNKNNIPVAGGQFQNGILYTKFTDNTLCSDKTTNLGAYINTLVVIILYGDENIKVASVEYNFTNSCSKEIEAKITKLKSIEKKGDSSFALMFQCDLRGKRLHGESHFETQIFRKIFPDTVLAGAFVEAEFCKDVIPGQSSTPSELSKHSSTSILFVSCSNI